MLKLSISRPLFPKKADAERASAALLYSITSSPRSMIDGGTARPSAVAVSTVGTLVTFSWRDQWRPGVQVGVEQPRFLLLHASSARWLALSRLLLQARPHLP